MESKTYTFEAADPKQGLLIEGVLQKYMPDLSQQKYSALKKKEQVIENLDENFLAIFNPKEEYLLDLKKVQKIKLAFEENTQFWDAVSTLEPPDYLDFSSDNFNDIKALDKDSNDYQLIERHF